MGHRAFDKFDLRGRTAVVTAGGTGMGYFMSRGLARSGAQVLIAARRETILKAAAAKLTQETGTTVHFDTVDLADRASIKTFNQRALEKLGTVDIFIGNAAQDLWEPADKVTENAIDTMFQVNVSSIMEMIRDFLPGMRQKKWGRILFSSSTTSIAASAQEGMSTYTATKGALNSLAHTIAVEGGHDGITCNSIILGMYVTDMLAEHLQMVEKAHGKEAAKAFTDSFASMVARGRLGRPDEVEGLIQLLASDAGGYITGSNLVADGGMAIMLRPNPPPAEPVYPPPF
jgi:NAD(P)-dependent dehydrogenase (short-subunit alcohol dehydrogenase family)